MKEVGLIALVAVAVFMCLAMWSYSPLDPAWSYQGSGRDVGNLVGVSGAWSADVMFSLFGAVAYLLPAALVIGGVRAARAAFVSWPLVAIRASGWLVVMVSSAVITRIHVAADAGWPAGPGGMLGDWLTAVGLPLFNWVGLTLLAVVALTLGSQAALGFSWLRLSESLGKAIYRLTGHGVLQIDRWRDRWQTRRDERAATEQGRSQRQLKVAEEKVKRANRKAPEIKVTAPGTPAGKSAPQAVKQQVLFDASDESLPGFDLLDDHAVGSQTGYSVESLDAMSRLLELKLKDFGVDAEVVSVLPGPVVTRFEIQPAAGVKVSRISGLAKDLARSLAVISVRIVEVIPGKSVVGIEIPNERRSIVRLKDLLTSPAYQDSTSPLSLALGMDIAGEPIVADIAKMPHLLIAGTTGSGKSVGVNAMLLSILYKASPEEVKLIMVDPKMLELSVYEGIPHLLTPVVTDMNEAAQALRWCVGEMERRYRLMAALGVRNVAGYNKRVNDKGPIPDPLWPDEAVEDAPDLEALPLIVVVIDEFADMMMIVGKKVEQLIARIAQKARAAGIHLVLATQRPSVDVITGLIKANIPTRLSFQVSSKVDSRTILDQGGAEQLLGHGDMLYLPPGQALPARVHGAFVSDEEVHRIAADWKKRGTPAYDNDVLSGTSSEALVIPGFDETASAEQDDHLYDEAVGYVLESRRASISAVQRKLRIGYNRAARLIEAMETAGVVSEMNTNGSREVLVPERD
jgi:S-DNA-T family DNA segregation ATPase FtsK/SpoIIIE